jgi:hypothetical protein
VFGETAASSATHETGCGSESVIVTDFTRSNAVVCAFHVSTPPGSPSEGFSGTILDSTSRNAIVLLLRKLLHSPLDAFENRLGRSVGEVTEPGQDVLERRFASIETCASEERIPGLPLLSSTLCSVSNLSRKAVLLDRSVTYLRVFSNSIRTSQL